MLEEQEGESRAELGVRLQEPPGRERSAAACLGVTGRRAWTDRETGRG